MANWLDLISLIATVSVFGGIIYVVLLVVRSVSQGVESAKEGLKTKGLHITDKGVAVKTSKRFDREDYQDATQRGIVNVVNASSFRKGGAAHDSDAHLSPPHLVQHHRQRRAWTERRRRRKGYSNGAQATMITRISEYLLKVLQYLPKCRETAGCLLCTCI
ncbi:hypothetical protein B0H13DRAFT_1703708 [Mycena leptocephala]|nr:hypothetical protein B0H13DRAFT_1703708 [Mycena leptocephala]